MKPVESRTAPAEALKLLEQAWAYYVPTPVPVPTDTTPELFQYANAA